MLYELPVSGLGEGAKGVFMAVSVTAGVAFDLRSFFLVVTTLKSSASAVSSMFAG
jgi:hypothetical protein